MKPKLFLILLMFLSLMACGKVEVGVESPTTTPRLQETIDAAVGTAVRVAAQHTEVAASPTPEHTPTPAVTETTASPSPTITVTPVTTATAPTNTPTATATSTRRPTATATPQPQILSFTAFPTQVEPGGSIFLNWRGVGESATLCLITVSQLVYVCSEVSLEDTLVYNLDPNIRESLTLELRVTARGLQAVYSNYINIACPADWWFFDDPPAACPAAEPVSTNAAFEAFERGFMIWLEDSDTIYVFFDSQHRRGPYMAFYGPLNLSTPTAPDPGEPPAGLYKPTSGFGHIWRGEVPGAYFVQSELGWALEPEYNFTAPTNARLRCTGRCIWNKQMARSFTSIGVLNAGFTGHRLLATITPFSLPRVHHFWWRPGAS